MKIITGTNTLDEPFIGNGHLVLNDKVTGNLCNFSLELVAALITSIDAGVTASIDDEQHLVLTSAKEIKLGGNQDVLDVVGVVAS